MEEEMEIPKEFEYLLRRVRSLQMVLGGLIHEQKVREAAEQGDANAQFELAGDAKSQFELANMYFHAPEGVERNIVLCEQWNDKALANDPDNVQSQNMQAYMLAERLRRVKNPPVITDVQSFTFTPLPTDIGNRFNPGDRGEKTYSVCCEACSAAVPVDRDKKYCGFCKVMVYCSKACQETDWKRHKKVCGKEGSQTPRAQDKREYKADIDVTAGYLSLMSGLGHFLQVLCYIHWNDCPVIQISTRAGTDGANLTVGAIPKSQWVPVHPDDGTKRRMVDVIARFYKDGPTKHRFPIEYNLAHLGPESAVKAACTTTVMEIQDNNTQRHGLAISRFTWPSQRGSEVWLSTSRAEPRCPPPWMK